MSDGFDGEVVETGALPPAAVADEPTSAGPTTEHALSHGQRVLWLLHQVEPESDDWTIAFVLRLRPPSDPAAARRAAQAVVDRHAALRATFPDRRGEPVQRIPTERAVAFEVVDSMDWSAERLEAALTAAGRRPIDLGRDPGLRVTLFRRADGDRLLAVIHHIAVDGWSLRLLLDDFRAFYRAERGGAPADLPPAGAPYTAFVDWQADLLAGPEGRRLAEYWRGRLTDDLPALALPADRARPGPATADRGQVRLTLPAELTGRVRALARAEGATIYTVLLTSLQVLLHRYTSQDDIAIGSPTAGRPQARFRRTVGYFVNPVVIRADLGGTPTFRHLLGRTRAAVAEALTHQHYPMSLLADLLRPAGTRGGWSLVQVTFNHQKVAYLGPLADAFLPADERPPTDGDREVELVSLKRETGAVELALDVLEAADRLHVAVDYRADRFDAATVERLLAHYQALLGAIVADPDRPIGDLELLAPGERRQVLREWNATAADYPAHACLHELIAAEAARSPDADAVVDARRRLTYRELDARANQVAHHLRELGVGPGRVVGLCLERSAELVVGLLGILKAGAAYLPLDPAYPAERLAVLLAEAGAMAVVAEAATAAALPVRGPRQVLLDADREVIARAPAGDPGRTAAPGDLAYVIFTSGSTGRPKGVAVEHRALVNFLTAMRTRPGLTARDTLLAVTTPAFDIAALELFLPLLVGARVAIAGSEAITDGRRLAALLASSGATVMQATPATWRLLLAAGWAGDRRLTALCGGETLPRALADDLLARCAALWNLYGPTETTVWSAALPVTPGAGPVPIGGPIANTQLYILDARRQPVPIGARGELCIGGVGLARGYLNRSELTAEQFVADPFAGDPAARLYRTGDLARWRADGTIELLGRLDDQLKVRGFRVEPGEIEAALTGHPAVAEAAVAARGQGAARRLVAYVVARGGAAVDGAEVRRFAGQRLPSYMVPSEVVLLARLPLTPGGKVDRRALPELGVEPGAGERPYAPPRDELELTLVAIWEEVLGRHPIGVTDDFFELGGTSLQAVQALARVEQTVRALPVATLFTASTVEQMAAIVRREGPVSPWRSLVAVRASGSRPPLFAVHDGSGMALFYREFTRLLGPDQPVFGLQARGLDGGEPLQTRIEEMAASYLDEVRRVQPAGPYYLLGDCVGGLIAYEMARQLQSVGEEVGLLAMIEAYPIGRRVPIELRMRGFARRLSAYFDVPKELTTLTWQMGSVGYWWMRGKLSRLKRAVLVHRRRDTERALSETIEDFFIVSEIAARRYRPGQFAGRPSLFVAKRRPFRDGHYPFADWEGAFGWAGLTSDGVDIHEIPGSHETILKEPNRAILVEQLARCLVAAQQD